MGLQKIDDRLASVSEKAYKQMVKQFGLTVPFKQWRQVVEHSNQEIARLALEDSMGFVLPFRMGILIVAKRKPWKKEGVALFMDRIHHCKTGEKIPQTNPHTFGFYYKLVYMPTKETNYFLNELWQFQATRRVNRKLASLIKAGKDYLTETYRFKHLYSN